MSEMAEPCTCPENLDRSKENSCEKHRDLFILPWRIGRSLGRTLYAAIEEEPSKKDICLGLIDTIELAEHTVYLHNTMLRSEWGK